MTTLQELTSERKRKKENLEKELVNPYPATSDRSIKIEEFLKKFTEFEKTNEHHTLAGRIRAIRSFGKLLFMNIEDESGELQLVYKQDKSDKRAALILENLDIGDIIEAFGTPFTTKKGEQSMLIETLKVLTKSLRPLPQQWYGLKEHEERYRRRYLDLIMNRDVRELFNLRSTFIQEIRNYWLQKEFLEVETPILENVPGGAEAEPFVTHHNTLDIDVYLRISLELHLKRLVVGGFEKIFEIGKIFRNEGMSTQHLQEFTMLELYWTYIDYIQLMEETEKFFTTIIQNTFQTLSTKYQNTTLKWDSPWPRMRYTEIFEEKTGIDLLSATTEELFSYAQKEHLDVEKQMEKGRLIDTIYKAKVRPGIIQPTFLIDHPIDVSPLSKRHRDNPKLTERFQVVVTGAEVYNAYSELNDPQDQRERFETQQQLRKKGDTEAYMMDEDFLQAIEYGMPPTAGMGMGIDRLFAILTDSASIRDVVFFPMMKPKSS